MNQSLGPLTLVVLVIPATALKIAIRVLYGRRPLASTDPMCTLLSMASNMMYVLAAIGATMGVWILVVPLTIVVIATILMVLVRRRQAEHRALLGSLATAAQHGVPLSECARAYADETLGDTGVRAMALAEALERGQPLSTAVRTARLWMSSATKMAVRVGEGLGLLGPALQQQLDDTNQTDATLRQTIGRFFYLWTVLIVLGIVLGFVMIKIAPVFQRMFQEFNIKLPWVTQQVIQWTRSGQFLLTVAVVLLVPLALLSALVAIFIIWDVLIRLWPIDRDDRTPFAYYLFFRRILRGALATVVFLLLFTFFVPSTVLLIGIIPVLAYIGWFPRDLPVIWRAFRRYDGALVMRGLALTVRRGLPLPQGIRLVADCYPIRMVSWRLRAAAQRVTAGLDWRESMRQTGLITRSDAAVLAAAERVGNLDWALEEMADSALRRQLYWVQMALQILFPIALLALGFVIAVFVVGLFIPIVSLIQGLYEQTMQ